MLLQPPILLLNSLSLYYGYLLYKGLLVVALHLRAASLRLHFAFLSWLVTSVRCCGFAVVADSIPLECSTFLSKVII